AEYREKEEVEYYTSEKDPVANFKSRLLEEKIITEEGIERIESEVDKKIKDAVAFAEKSPEPKLEEFLEEVEQI
ncbi:unnamed protein product, partial [marine sediment metagenome]